MWWILWVVLGLTAVFLYGELTAIVGEAKVYAMLCAFGEMDKHTAHVLLDIMYDDETLGSTARNKLVKFYLEVWVWWFYRNEGKG